MSVGRDDVAADPHWMTRRGDDGGNDERRLWDDEGVVDKGHRRLSLVQKVIGLALSPMSFAAALTHTHSYRCWCGR